jgi:hypothetical protein
MENQELIEHALTNKPLIEHALKIFGKKAPFPKANEEVVYYRSCPSYPTWASFWQSAHDLTAKAIQLHIKLANLHADREKNQPALAIFLQRKLPDGTFEYLFRGR